jgi:DNA adenine methylase
LSIEWERADDGSFILKIKLPPGVEPPRDLTLVSLEPLIIAGGIKDAVAKAVLADSEPEKARRILRYPGGDHYLINELRALFERAPNVETFVEVFGGSGVASYTVAKELRRKFKVIIYNDIDDYLVNFFRVLREKPHELIRELTLIPWSRALRDLVRSQYVSGELEKLSDVERAALYYFLLRASINALAHHPAAFRSAATHDLAGELKNAVAALPEFAKVWKRVQVENLDFRKCIEKYDRSTVLFYCDPPHLEMGHHRELYRYSFTVKDMHDLIKQLSRVRGKFVLKLPEDHLKIPFIREFAERYSVVKAKMNRYDVVDEGEEREKLDFIFIYNFGDRSAVDLEEWLRASRI